MRSFSLDGTWELYGSPEVGSPLRQPADLADHSDLWVTGQVPGNVELDLVRAGELPDPFFGDNIQRLQPYELYEWWYQREFDAPPLRVGSEPSWSSTALTASRPTGSTASRSGGPRMR